VTIQTPSLSKPLTNAIPAVEFYGDIECRFSASTLKDPRIVKCNTSPPIWRIPLSLEISLGPALVSFRFLLFDIEIGTKTLSFKSLREATVHTLA
jgi:hypothetical protein